MNSIQHVEKRGLLIHVSHYDPSWCQRKDLEEPFDVETAIEIVKAMAINKFNILIVDCADGIVYKSHPELKRHYTVPMSDLTKLAKVAHEYGIDIIPKLNFAKSGRNKHDTWLMPHVDQISWTLNLDQYWKIAEELIEELTVICKPNNFFHIGMDEDHYRSYKQYVDAIKILDLIVKKRNLRTVIWNDSCYLDNDQALAQVHAEKSFYAEKHLPRDIVHVLWDYGCAHPAAVKRISSLEYEVWGAPGTTAEKVTAWKEAILENNGKGLIMTKWRKCCKSNKDELIEMLNTLGGAYR